MDNESGGYTERDRGEDHCSSFSGSTRSVDQLATQAHVGEPGLGNRILGCLGSQGSDQVHEHHHKDVSSSGIVTLSAVLASAGMSWDDGWRPPPPREQGDELIGLVATEGRYFRSCKPANH